MTCKAIFLAVLSVTALTACSNSQKEQLGLLKTAPDEFSIVTRAPLSVPPEYTLRPPRPGVDRPMEMQTGQRARQTLFGVSDVNETASGEAAPEFMDRIGVNNADRNIRERLVEDSAQPDETQRRPVGERLLFWRDNSDNGDVIDPKEELERIQSEAPTGSE